MLTIKVYLAESGRVADLKKDFPLYQGAFQNKLLNVFVPTSITAPEFVQSKDGKVLSEFVASTAVKIGMTYIDPITGVQKTSKNYYLNYLKTLTYQGVEYALYERKLPKEFTLYAGQGQNAPVLVANVVNIQNDTEKPKVLSVITTQSCYLDVMASSELDNDEAIEPTELERLNAEINETNENLAKKQDKEDPALATKDKTVVGAINELNTKSGEHDTSLESQQKEIAQNKSEIEKIKELYTQPEDYIGQFSGDTLPTGQQLTEFVYNHTDPKRQPKNGDVVIFIQTIEGKTDKNFKYIYSQSGWDGYEIPPMEQAYNGSLGLVQGTYNIGDEAETLVDISGGKILHIFVKDGTGVYRDIREYANSLKTQITDIISGNQSVGLALKSLADGLGNNIVDTYLTQNAGATKKYVRDYALPREFNDVSFVSKDGYSSTIPTKPISGVQFSVESTAVGDYTLATIDKDLDADFELSSKNSYTNHFYVSADRDCVVYFRLTTQAKKPAQDYVDLNIELSNAYSLKAGEIVKVSFASSLNALGDKVITLTTGDQIRQTLEIVTQASATTQFDLYSNETYPSVFNLNTSSQTIVIAQGELGEQPIYELEGTLVGDTLTFDLPLNVVLYNNTECELKLTYTPSEEITDATKVVLTLDGETIRLVTPYNANDSEQATLYNLKQVEEIVVNGKNTLVFKGFIEVSGSDTIIRVDIDDLTTARKEIKETTDTLDKKIDSNRQDLEKKITDTDKATNQKFDDLTDKLDKKIDTEKKTLDDKIDKTKNDLENEISAIHENILLLKATGEEQDEKILFTVSNTEQEKFIQNLREFLVDLTLTQVSPDISKKVVILFKGEEYEVFDIKSGSEQPATLNTLRGITRYNGENTFRLVSKMIMIIEESKKYFAITPTIVNNDVVALTDSEMTDYTRVGGLVEGQLAICKQVTQNAGFVEGNIYKFMITYPTTYSWVRLTNYVNVQGNEEIDGKTFRNSFYLKNTSTNKIIEFRNPDETIAVLVDDQTLIEAKRTEQRLYAFDKALAYKEDVETAPYVDYSKNQILTDEQKGFARSNIGAGVSSFSGSYNDVTQKPTLNTDNADSQLTDASQLIDGEVKLHKISKTGQLKDAITDNEHTSVTQAEKEQITTNKDKNAEQDNRLVEVEGRLDVAEADIDFNEDRIGEINEKIPEQATRENQLADKAFVNSSINNSAAYYITSNAGGEAFANYAALKNATTFYSGGKVRTPTRNDYCVVLADETKKDELGQSPTTRYTYQVAEGETTGQWEFQYIVNRTALTSAQVLAINSGITSTLVAQITTNKNNIATNTQNIATNAANITTNKNNIATLDGSVVKKTGDQEINGVKNFIGTLKINGGTIAYDSSTQTFTI